LSAILRQLVYGCKVFIMALTDDRNKEIARLETLDRELHYADAEFEHQQRRYRDQLERSGTDRAFAADSKRINRNRRNIALERAEIAEKLSALKVSANSE
jgi:hypothetical protein